MNTVPVKVKRTAFAAFASRGYRVHFATYLVAMMADSIEHVISYWVCYQKFHSAELGGFAVVSHWLPFLVFAVPVGALNDRFDSRRLIQIGMVLFMAVSLGWGVFFVTDTLTMPAAMALLIAHGCAGVLWQTSSQMLLYDIAGPELLPSAVRLNATARSLGLLVGPAVGALVMVVLGPTRGIFINAVLYLPLFVWLIRAPYGRHLLGVAGPRMPVRGFADILQTLREIRPVPVLMTMTALAGAASFFIGNGYQAQMPAFAADLGHGDPGTAYSLLLGADAAGALAAGFVLESRGGLLAVRPLSAILLALGWCTSLVGFAVMDHYAPAVLFLFLAGFFELSSSSMAQTLVQIHAPEASRGRVLGLFNMAALGLRMFSGITVGLAGGLVGVHASLAGAAIGFGLVTLLLLRRVRRSGLA